MRSGIGVLVCALFLAACSQEISESQPGQVAEMVEIAAVHEKPALAEMPNLVLISLDTLRADHLGSYGYTRRTSPHLDQLAAQGVRFDQVVAPSTWTFPSHVTMLSGLDPSNHGAVLFRKGSRIPESVPTLAERLRKAGYTTGALVGGGWVTSWRGFSRGFDSFQEQRDEHVFPGRLKRIVAAAGRWIRSNAKGPFFLFLHTYQVHMPYTPAPAYARSFLRASPGSLLRKFSFEDLKRLGDEKLRNPVVLDRVRALYDAEIRETDALIGTLMKQIRRTAKRRRICVLVASDHGEAFNEHGHLFHDRAVLYEEVSRVPLLLWCSDFPRSLRGRVVEEPVGVVDITPTLLELAGLEPGGELDGRSLVALFDGDSASGAAAPRDRVLVSDVDLSIENPRDIDPVGDYVLALRLGSLKLVYESRSGARRLYDLAEDPGESSDLATERPEALLAFEPTLMREIERRAALPAYEPTAEALPEDQQNQLRALGYILPDAARDE